jgi:hypothetical protein
MTDQDNRVAFAILVPLDLTLISYDVAVLAEILFPSVFFS